MLNPTQLLGASWTEHVDLDIYFWLRALAGVFMFVVFVLLLDWFLKRSQRPDSAPTITVGAAVETYNRWNNVTDTNGKKSVFVRGIRVIRPRRSGERYRGDISGLRDTKGLDVVRSPVARDPRSTRFRFKERGRFLV
ncbi:MAG: hypothetical protein ABI672_17795 [Vicinamibacteria bacterium]